MCRNWKQRLDSGQPAPGEVPHKMEQSNRSCWPWLFCGTWGKILLTKTITPACSNRVVILSNASGVKCGSHSHDSRLEVPGRREESARRPLARISLRFRHCRGWTCLIKDSVASGYA